MEEEIKLEEQEEFDWKGHIREVFEDIKDKVEFLYSNNETEAFIWAIWKMSTEVL